MLVLKLPVAIAFQSGRVVHNTQENQGYCVPQLKSTAAGRYQLLSRWWDAYRKQLGLKDFSPKSQDAVALQQIKERGALPMIDRGDIRQAIDRCSNIWASLPGAGYGQFEHKADSLIAKFKEAGGTVREIEV